MKQLGVLLVLGWMVLHCEMHMVDAETELKGDDKKLFVEVYPPDEMEDPLENMRSYNNMNKVQFGLDDLQTAMEKVTRDRQSPYPVPSWGSSFMNNMKVPGMMGASNYQGGFLMEQKLMTNLGLPRFQQQDDQNQNQNQNQFNYQQNQQFQPTLSLQDQQQQLYQQQQKQYQAQLQQQNQQQNHQQNQQQNIQQSEDDKRAEKTVKDLQNNSFHDIFSRTLTDNHMNNPREFNQPQVTQQKEPIQVAQKLIKQKLNDIKQIKQETKQEQRGGNIIQNGVIEEKKKEEDELNRERLQALDNRDGAIDENIPQDGPM